MNDWVVKNLGCFFFLEGARLAAGRAGRASASFQCVDIFMKGLDPNDFDAVRGGGSYRTTVATAGTANQGLQVKYKL